MNPICFSVYTKANATFVSKSTKMKYNQYLLMLYMFCNKRHLVGRPVTRRERVFPCVCWVPITDISTQGGTVGNQRATWRAPTRARQSTNSESTSWRCDHGASFMERQKLGRAVDSLMDHQEQWACANAAKNERERATPIRTNHRRRERLIRYSGPVDNEPGVKRTNRTKRKSTQSPPKDKMKKAKRKAQKM